MKTPELLSWMAAGAFLLTEPSCCEAFSLQSRRHNALHPCKSIQQHALGYPCKMFKTSIRASKSHRSCRHRGERYPTRTTHSSLCAQATVGIVSPYPSWVYMSILALQFGLQPILTKLYTPSNIIRSTVVLAQDLVRMLTAGFLLFSSGCLSDTAAQWTFSGAVLGAGLPSALYLVQNYCTIMAYQNLAPVTFNVLNQTKTLSAALCCFLIMGKIQSPLQIVSLFVLLTSALVIEKIIPLNPWQDRQNARANNNAVSDASEIEDECEEEEESSSFSSAQTTSRFKSGVLPVLLASFISGLGKILYTPIYCIVVLVW